MSSTAIDQSSATATGDLPIVDLLIQLLRRRLRQRDVSYDVTTITQFRANYADLLERANAGHVQAIKRGKEQYVLLSMDQMASLVAPQTDQRSLAELFRGLPTISDRKELRAVPAENEADAFDQYRLPSQLLSR